MAAQEQKKSAKGQKIGRNGRAPSNKMQAQRTERNKRLALERAHKLKMKAMPAGGKSTELYGPHLAINAASKFVQACFQLYGLKLARMAIQREVAA